MPKRPYLASLKWKSQVKNVLMNVTLYEVNELGIVQGCLTYRNWDNQPLRNTWNWTTKSS